MLHLRSSRRTSAEPRGLVERDEVAGGAVRVVDDVGPAAAGYRGDLGAPWSGSRGERGGACAVNQACGQCKGTRYAGMLFTTRTQVLLRPGSAVRGDTARRADRPVAQDLTRGGSARVGSDRQSIHGAGEIPPHIELAVSSLTERAAPMAFNNVALSLAPAIRQTTSPSRKTTMVGRDMTR